MKRNKWTIIAAVVLLVGTALVIGHMKADCDQSGGMFVRGIIGYECAQSKVAK